MGSHAMTPSLAHGFTGYPPLQDSPYNQAGRARRRGNFGLIGIKESLCKRLRFDPVACPHAHWDRRKAVTAFLALEIA